jgi:hypothetical protein
MDIIAPAEDGRKTSGLAITSLVLGVLSIGLFCLTGLPAAICGHVATARIKTSGGTLTGGGLALAGTIIGYAMTVLGVLAILLLPVFSKVSEPPASRKARYQARQLFIACKLYAADYGGYPDSFQQLVAEELISDSSLLYPRIPLDGLPPGEPLFRLLVPGVNESEIEPSAPVIVSVVPVGRAGGADEWVVVKADGSTAGYGRDELLDMGIDPDDLAPGPER